MFPLRDPLQAVMKPSTWPSGMPQILATSSGTLALSGVVVGGIARVVVVLIGEG